MCGFSWPEAPAESHSQLQASLVIMALHSDTTALKPVGQAQLRPAAPGICTVGRQPSLLPGLTDPRGAARDLSLPKTM